MEKMYVVTDYDADEMRITIPIDLLIFAQENNPDNPCKIINKGQMIEYFERRFLSFGEDDDKGSDFECLLDKFFSDATEYGEPWIEFLPVENE